MRALLPVLLLLACSGGPPELSTPPPAGAVSQFTVSARSVAKAGDKVTLTWATKDAQRVGLEQVGFGPLGIDAAQPGGTLEVTIVTDTTFVLTAAGEGGTDSAVLRVQVEGGLGAPLFTASPGLIDPGGSSTLVWNVPGATAVTLTPMGGAALDLKGQTASGSVVVSPALTTRYVLAAGAVTATVDLVVRATILSFTSGPSPLPGQMVKLSWQTTGGAKLTLTRDGLTAPIHIETAAATILSGSFDDTAPNLPTDGIIGYHLKLEQGTQQFNAALEVRIGGGLKLNRFTAPAYVRAGLPYSVSWQTTGATALEVLTDGTQTYAAPDLATVAAGGTALPAFTTSTQRVRLNARDNRGGLVTDERVVESVGAVTFVSFTANLMSIANAGSPVVLSWNVTNARDVSITQTGVGQVFSARGNVATGMATVFPNRSSSVYVLNATNGAGDAIAPQTLTVMVGNTATLTFESLVPVGAQTRVTGHTVTGGGAVWGLPVAVKNQQGEAFVDISTTGFPVSHVFDSDAAVTALPETVNMVLFGRRVSSNSISTSPNGWLMFSSTAVHGPNTNSPIGTALEPLALAPYFKDLQFTAPAETYGRFDTVGADRRLIVQWTDLEDKAFPGSKLTFQLQLYSSGKVVFAYGKLQGVSAVDGAIGIVNGSETQVLSAGSAPAVNDTFTFFGAATLPVLLRIESVPYVARVAVGAGFVEVEGDGRLPANAFIISEVNPRPAATVVSGEWLEVTNLTTSAFNLNGWTLNFGGGNQHVIASSVPLPPNGRIVLAQAANLGEPTAGVTAAYVYPSTLAMNDTSGTVSLELGAPYTSFTWSATSVPAAGTSARQDPPLPNAVYAGSPVCASTGTGTYGAGQVGTPGAAAAPPCVVGHWALSSVTGAFQSIAATGTRITAAADDTRYIVALPTPLSLNGAMVSTLYVCSNGWITATATTSTSASNKSTPSTSNPVGSIGVFWDDLVNTSLMNAGMYWQQFNPDMMAGTGDEYTLVSWEHWRVYGAPSDGHDLNFQAKFLANGNVELHYGAMVQATAGGTTHQGSGATEWVEDPAGKYAIAAGVNQPVIAANSGYRFTYLP